LAAGTALGLFAQIGLLAHLFSLLVPAVGAQLAGIAISAATMAAIAGRTLVGWLMPVGADRRLVACGSFAVQITGSIAFLIAGGSHIPLLMLGIILFGVGIGNATSLPPLIAQAEFARQDLQGGLPECCDFAGNLRVRAGRFRIDQGICPAGGRRGGCSRSVSVCCRRTAAGVGARSLSRRSSTRNVMRS
jgi:hypothetical protein